MRRKRTYFVAVAASIMGYASSAFAQMSPSSHAPSFAGETIPDGTSPVVTAQFGAAYNSNVAASSAQFAAIRGLELADTTYSPSLVANFYHAAGPYSVFLGGSAGYVAYQHNSILNREYIETIAGASVQASRCQLTVGGSYIRRQTDLQELTIAATQNTQQIAGPEADIACNQSGTLVPSLVVSETFSSNSNPLLIPSNYNQFSAHGSVLYNRPVFAEISLIGQYSKADFPNRSVVVGNEIRTDGFQVYSAGGQVERHFGSDIDLRFSISETLLRSSFGTEKNFTGVTYDAVVFYQPTSRLTGQIEVSRQTLPSLVQNTSYTVDEIYLGEIGYQFTSRLLLKLGASDKHQDFVGNALVPGVNMTRQSINSFFGSLGFDINPRLSVTLTVTHNQRSADVSGYDYGGQLVGLTISRSF